MKLILCPHCQDVKKLQFRKTSCQCKKSYGKYLDEVNAEIGGDAIPIGFDNGTLANAIINQPKQGLGYQFNAFVIPKQCKSITNKGK